MEIIVNLDINNTEFKKDQPANVTVTVYLDSIWNQIKVHNRIYVSTYITVPILRQQKQEMMEIVLREYYDVNKISTDEKGTFVIMKGYIEGEIADRSNITTRCSVWCYDCN